MNSPRVISDWYSPRNPDQFSWFGVVGVLSFGLHFLGQARKNILRQAQTLSVNLDDTKSLADEQLQNRISHSRKRLRRSFSSIENEIGQDLLLEVVQLLSELARLTLGLTPSAAQIAAVIAVAQGTLIQLAPGEGKTLSIAMAAVIFAWRERPCHVVTANEYLAERDAALMSPLFAACGLTVRSITHETPPAGLAYAYRSQVIYATANQFLADFLRDDLLLDGANKSLTRRLWRLRAHNAGKHPVLRGLYAAIIDEADGVLIDDATTPLIISQSEKDRSEMLVAVQTAHRFVEFLYLMEDYEIIIHPVGQIQWTDAGQEKINSMAHYFSDYWQRQNRIEDVFKTAIFARDQFILDRHYIVQHDKIVIIDDNTGRAMPGRNWSHGIHQAIEAKENIKLTQPTKTVARMTFQEFFRHYHVLCGASGTLRGLDFELWRTYGLNVMRIPPKKKSQLCVRERKIYRTQAEKFNGLIAQVRTLHARHVPVLVGTRRIQDSEDIAQALKQQGLYCTVLNAKQHQYEAEIIGQAGTLNAITVATNMAGRGTDIAIDTEVEKLGGLQVLMYEPHESSRVDWQLFGRAGRQGAQGAAQAFASLEDELLTRFLPRFLKPLLWLSMPDYALKKSMPVLLWIAQKRAQKNAAHQRRQLAAVQAELRRQLSFVSGR